MIDLIDIAGKNNLRFLPASRDDGFDLMGR